MAPSWLPPPDMPTPWKSSRFIASASITQRPSSVVCPAEKFAVSVMLYSTSNVYSAEEERMVCPSVQFRNVCPSGTAAFTVTDVPSSNSPEVLPSESVPPTTVTVNVSVSSLPRSPHPTAKTVGTSTRASAVIIVLTVFLIKSFLV